MSSINVLIQNQWGKINRLSRQLRRLENKIAAQERRIDRTLGKKYRKIQMELQSYHVGLTRLEEWKRERNAI